MPNGRSLDIKSGILAIKSQSQISDNIQITNLLTPKSQSNLALITYAQPEKTVCVKTVNMKL